MTKLLRLVRDFLTRNIGLKLLSLSLAVLIHIVVQRDSVREAELEVPLSLTNVAPDRVFVGSLPDVVKVRVRGRWGGIRELLSDRASRIVVDAGQYRDGERHVFEHRRVQQQLSSRNVEVLAVDPPSLQIRLEPIDFHDVPVDVGVTGQAAAGYEVLPRDVKTDPARVTVSGPRREVRKITSIRATTIDVAGTDADLRVISRLLPPAEGHVRLSQESVTVEVKLRELNVTRTLTGQPVVVRGCPPAAQCLVTPPEVGLRVEGLVRAVSAFIAGPPGNLVFADVDGPIRRNERAVKLSVNAIKGLALTVEPGTAKFTLLSEVPPTEPVPAGLRAAPK